MVYPHIMELKEALAQQQAKQDRLRQVREGVAAELARLDGELDEITADVSVLSRLVAHYEGDTAAKALVVAQTLDSPADGADWQHLSRMKAVERVLNEFSEPVEPPDIRQVLRDHGRDDTSKNIHAALGHLKIKHRATQVGRGKWIPLNRANGQVAKEVAAGLS
jgi:hypothetical protein